MGSDHLLSNVIVQTVDATRFRAVPEDGVNGLATTEEDIKCDGVDVDV